MAKINLLDPARSYNGADVKSSKLRGTERCTIYLAEAFARLGHDVCVYTQSKSDVDVNNVRWKSWEYANKDDDQISDLDIANNHAQYFNKTESKSRIVWLHNPTSVHKAIRKSDLWALFRYRPNVVMGSEEVATRTSTFLPFRERLVIKHGLSPNFLTEQTFRAPPPPTAIFNALPRRGLEWLLEVWRDFIAPIVPDARLDCYIGASAASNLNWADFSFARRLELVSSDEMARALRHARILANIGHPDETFCLAAAEAHACGVPLMTRGIGALRERVRDGVDGYLCSEPEAFAERMRALLTDDILWRRMHIASFDNSDCVDWDRRAHEWAALFGLGRPNKTKSTTRHRTTRAS